MIPTGLTATESMRISWQIDREQFFNVLSSKTDHFDEKSDSFMSINDARDKRLLAYLFATAVTITN